MARPALVFVPVLAVALAADLSAQGVLPLNGSYAFASLRADVSCNGLPLGGVSSDRGTGTFLPGGTFSYSGQEDEACGGTLATRPVTEAGTYVVTKEGNLLLDLAPAMPGTDIEEFSITPDGSLFVATRLLPDPEGYLSVGVRLSAGQTNGSLAGTYALVRLELGGTASGLGGASDLGDVVFDGVGAYSGSLARRTVTPVGTTATTTMAMNGTYAVQPDGRITLAADLAGAMTADGSFFYALDADGDTKGLVLGVRRGVALTSAAISRGLWGVAISGAVPSTFPEVFTVGLIGGFTPTSNTTGTLAFGRVEIATDPTGTSSSTGSGLFGYTLSPSGSVDLTGPPGPPIPLRVDDGGKILILRDPEPAVLSIGVGIQRCPPSTTASARRARAA